MYLNYSKLMGFKGKFAKIKDSNGEQIAYICDITVSDDGSVCYIDKRYGMYLNEAHSTYDAEFSPIKIRSIEEYSIKEHSLDDHTDGYLGAINRHIAFIKNNKMSLSFEIPKKIKERLGLRGEEYKSAEEYLKELANG